MSILFATVRLGEEVHAQALGFTRVIYEFVMVDDGLSATDAHQKASELVKQWCDCKGIKFDRIWTLRESLQQDPERYTFPEQIIGYDRPLHLVEADRLLFG